MRRNGLRNGRDGGLRGFLDVQTSPTDDSTQRLFISLILHQHPFNMEAKMVTAARTSIGFLVIAVGFATHSNAQGSPSKGGTETETFAKKGVGKALRWGEPGARVGGVDLIKVPTVQNELSLSAKQVEQIGLIYGNETARLAEAAKARARAIESGQQAGPLSVDKSLTEADVLTILSTKQRERFREIQLQHLGVKAFRRTDVIERLNLSLYQQESIGSVFSELEQAKTQLADGKRQALGEFQERRAQLSAERYFNPNASKQRLRDIEKHLDDVTSAIEKYDARHQRSERELEPRAKKEIGRILTKRQRDQFDNMLGAPFDFVNMPLVNQVDKPEPGPTSARKTQ